LLLIAIANIFSAVPIVFYSTENFPEVDVKFMLVNNTNNVLTSMTQQDAGIIFYDNGVPLNLTSFNTSEVSTDKAYIVIAFDLSISCRTNNPADFTFAVDAANKYISYLADGQTDASLISISTIPSVELDFTSSMSSLAALVNDFTAKNFGNLYRGITLENTGALSVLENVNTSNKSILLITQGIISSDEAELIISKSKQAGIKINILYINNTVPKNINRIADETGGYCINKQTMNKIGLPVFATMAKLSEGYTPYSLTANASLNCDGEHIFKLNTNYYSFSEIITEADDIKLTRIEINPGAIEFPFVKPGASETKKVTIYARNSNLTIDNIYLDNLLFSVVSGLPTTFPYFLSKDDSLELQIKFSPVDSCISFTRLLITSDACLYDTLFLTGGYPNVPPRISSIKIVNPECNDVLIVGDTIEIEWNGVLPNDVVSIFSQNVEDVVDTIAKNIIGLKRQFIIKDNGQEDSINFIVNQMWPNNIGKTLDFRHSSPVLSAYFNNYEDRIITMDNDNFVTIWNANSGDKIYTFPKFNKKVNYAIYAPNPRSVDDNYIGIVSEDSCVYIYDANDYSIYWKYNTATEVVFSIEFSSDCKYAVISLGNGYFEILDIEKKQRILKQYINAENCRFAIFHPTKQYEIMAISYYTGIIRFYDIEGNLLDTIDARGEKQILNTEYVCYNYDGSKVLITNYQDLTADLIDRFTGNLIYSLSHNESGITNNLIYSATFFHKENAILDDEDYILTSGKDGILRRWNVSDGSPSASDFVFVEHKLAVNTGVLSKDGWRMLSSSDDSTAKIWNLNQKILQSDTTCKLRIAYAKGKVYDTLDFGSVFQGEIILKTFDSAFTNICDFSYNIRAIRIVGDNFTDFNIIDEFDFPMNINGLRNIGFNIAFRPTLLGKRTAKIQIVLPNDTMYIVLIGIGLNIGLQPLCELIDFRNTFIDDYKDTLLAVAVNISDTIINIENINLTGPQKSNYKFITNNNNLLNPGDTLFAAIRFFPLTIGKKNMVMNIKHSYHSYPLNFNFTGKGVSIINDTVQISINNLNAGIGETINCPIMLNTLTHNNISDIKEITFSLIFNSSILYPRTNSNEVKILDSKYLDNGNKIIRISIPYKLGSQQIDGLQFLALWGNDTTTDIQIINSISFNNSRCYIVGNTATFNLINVYYAGGTRLFDEKGKLVLYQNVPNPVIDETKIEFELIESGLTSFDIYDITGSHIMNMFYEYKPKGTYTIKLDVEKVEKLNAGMYYYILENASHKQIRTMLIK
jgi:WD40 repeat protein